MAKSRIKKKRRGAKEKRATTSIRALRRPDPFRNRPRADQRRRGCSSGVEEIFHFEFSADKDSCKGENSELAKNYLQLSSATIERLVRRILVPSIKERSLQSRERRH